MLSENKIILEPDERYNDLNSAIQYVTDYMIQQGESVHVKSRDSLPVLDISGQEYTLRLSQRLLGPFPPQIIVLEKV